MAKKKVALFGCKQSAVFSSYQWSVLKIFSKITLYNLRNNGTICTVTTGKWDKSGCNFKLSHDTATKLFSNLLLFHKEKKSQEIWKAEYLYNSRRTILDPSKEMD